MLTPVVVVCLLCADMETDANWPGFRGDGSSRAQSAKLPLEWSGQQNVAWRVRVPGYGQSTPVVWQDRVFVTSVEGARRERCLVTCFHAATGASVWQKSFDASQPGANNPSTSRAAPTPIVDASGVYVFFEGGDLIGLGPAGNVRWKRSLPGEIGEIKNHHGIASSLAQTNRALFVLLDHGGPSFLMSVDKATGQTLWKKDRPNGLSWTSPVVARFGKREYAVVSSNGTLTIYDVENGKEACALAGLTGNLIPSPAVCGSAIVVGAGESGLTFDLQAAARSNRCYTVALVDDRPHCELRWQGVKTVAHHASPVIHNGHVYLLTKVGVVQCLDLATGEERFAQRLASPCWATPIAAQDRLYFFGKDGVTTVLQSGPKFVKLATNSLWDEATVAARKESARALPESKFPSLPEQGRQAMEAMLDDAVGDVVYGVAAAGDAFFIRTGTELLCVRESSAE